MDSTRLVWQLTDSRYTAGVAVGGRYTAGMAADGQYTAGMAADGHRHVMSIVYVTKFMPFLEFRQNAGLTHKMSSHYRVIVDKCLAIL